jgi:hypothetical protein
MDDFNDVVTQRGGRGLLGSPFRLVGRLLVAAFRLGWWSARVPVRVTARTTRVLGFKALVFFGAGLVIGVLFAPYKGAALREQLRRRLATAKSAGPVEDPELATKVGFELAHAPRTWHLPQPEVAVLSGRVQLTGEVPHARGREELERVAAAIPGVVGVENKLVVSTEPGQS